MRIETVRTTCRILAVVAGIFGLLAILTQETVFYWIMIGLLVAYIIILIAFWRCPFCKKTLGHWGNKHCSQCGKELPL